MSRKDVLIVVYEQDAIRHSIVHEAKFPDTELELSELAKVIEELRKTYSKCKNFMLVVKFHDNGEGNEG